MGSKHGSWDRANLVLPYSHHTTHNVFVVCERNIQRNKSYDKRNCSFLTGSLTFFYPQRRSSMDMNQISSTDKKNIFGSFAVAVGIRAEKIIFWESESGFGIKNCDFADH
jgi:hypothetical protein